MGAEASCRLRVAREAYEGTAYFETDELLFRGAPREGVQRFRLAIPLSSIRGATASSGELRVRHDGGEAVFELGERAAAKWAERIRVPKSLIDKLDVKPAHTVSVLAVGDDVFLREVRARAERVVVGKLAPKSDVVFLGASTTKDLDRIEGAAHAIARDGAVWVIHPKGPHGLPDLEIFAAGKRAGLTAVKVARFSATHTAEKLVIPKASR